MLPWSSVAEQVRSIQKTAGGDFLPSAANEQADDSMGRNAGMSFDDVEVGKVYEGRVVRPGRGYTSSWGPFCFA